MDISSPTLREMLAFLSGLALAIPSYVTLYRNWKKSRIEEREAEARTQHTIESTASMRLRDDLATGEGIGKMLASMIETGENLSQLQKRMFELEQDQIELTMVRQDVKQLKGLLDAHGISYSEKDNARTAPLASKGIGVVRE